MSDIARSKEKNGRFVIFGLVIFALIIIIPFLSHSIWKSSGSNEWRLKIDKDDIKVWSLKSPGTCLLKLKAQWRLKSKLGDVVYFMRDPTGADDFGASDVRIFEKQESPSGYSAYYAFKVDMPFPLGKREFVMLIHDSQDRETGTVEVNVLAAPNKVHPSTDCVRIKHLNNIWRFTPLKNGELACEAIQDMNVSEPLPYFISNLIMPNALHKNLKVMEELLKSKKYTNTDVAYIKEFEEIAESKHALSTTD
ncbi:MAG: hypothetical protein GF344_10750 [Chitinivibrionales bacterium]|nr:hypothetical protein [Chitinivibrionales bacterium]